MKKFKITGKGYERGFLGIKHEYTFMEVIAAETKEEALHRAKMKNQTAVIFNNVTDCGPKRIKENCNYWVAVELA